MAVVVVVRVPMVLVAPRGSGGFVVRAVAVLAGAVDTAR